MVPSSHSSRLSCASLIHDCSLGRTGNVGDFLWINPVTAVVFDGGSAKRCRARVFRSKRWAAGEGAGDDTKPRICRYRSGGEPGICGSRTVRSATDVITTDNSDSAENDPISLVSKNPAVMASEDAGGTPKHSRCVEIGGRLTSDEDLCDSNWDICGWVQYRVCTMFSKSIIAWVHVFLNKVDVSLKEGLGCYSYKLRRQIIGDLQQLCFCCTGFRSCRNGVLAGWPWGHVHDAEPSINFVPPVLLADGVFLAWCFCFSPQELAPSVVGLQHELYFLLAHVRLAAGYFSHLFFETVF